MIINNREIKFRVWDGNMFLYSAELGYNGIDQKPKIEQECLKLSFLFGKVLIGVKNINNIIIQQYTGLKDKNSKEIYEGDILSGETKDTIFDKLLCDFESEYGTYSFTYILDKNINFKYTYKQLFKLKIIGNIFENPELIQIK